MSTTDDLIEQLAASAPPPQRSLGRFLLPLAMAMLLCTFGVAMLLEGAFAPAASDGLAPIMVKWGFSLALLAMSAGALWAIGQPGRRTSEATRALAIPFALVALLLVLELVVGGRPFPGTTWQRCLIAMAMMSPLAFAGAIMAARWLAPTQLRRAGMVAGLYGGAVAMTAYVPFCPGHGMAYLAVFYCLPILAMAGLGWILGPRLLRW
ncbi:MAG: DUF1109 domain-containing protein [Erythrobacter sp.]|nr:DUF1109 domain-containing protein [Erythrobacter sp.]